MASLIVSPHLDDAVLSMGGYLLLRKNKDDMIVTLFNTAWTSLGESYTTQEITEMNLKEEMSVVFDIGCGYKFCGLNEALLRDYKKWNEPLRKKKDKNILEQIKTEIQKELGNKKLNKVFFPLAIGDHVDHVLVYEAARQMKSIIKEQGISLYFYEDIPYAAYGGREERLCMAEQDFTLWSEKIDITDYFDEKCRYLRRYRSQLTEEDIEGIKKYAGEMNGVGMVTESVWLAKYA